jgi:hypothetical protein
MRRGLSILLVVRFGNEHTRTRKSLEWFGPPERNILLHCVSLSCVLDDLGLFFFSWSCVVMLHASLFIAQSGACTKVLSPDMWA